MIPGTIFSQTKVGTYGGQFLLESPSVRSNGMGQLGVALVDEYSFYFNPGSLGLSYLENHITLTPYSGTSYKSFWYKIKKNYPSLMLPIFKHKYKTGNSIGLNFAFSYSRISSEHDEIDYFRQPSETFKLILKSYNASIGFGFKGPIEVGAGVNIKYFEEYYISGVAVDLGFILRAPLGKLIKMDDKNYCIIITPSIGYSHSNMGPFFRTGGFYDDLNSANRYGVALTLGLDYKMNFGNWNIATATSSIEDENRQNKFDYSKIGVEIDVLEAFAIRTGKPERESDYSTWGFTVNSRGIMKSILFLTGGESSKSNFFINFFTNKLTLKYLQSHNNSTLDGIIYRGFTVNFNLSQIN